MATKNAVFMRLVAFCKRLNYSTKGEGRGIGLYKLWKKCKEFGGYICVMEDILDDKNAVKFKMILPI